MKYLSRFWQKILPMFWPDLVLARQILAPNQSGTKAATVLFLLANLFFFLRVILLAHLLHQVSLVYSYYYFPKILLCPCHYFPTRSFSCLKGIKRYILPLIHRLALFNMSFSSFKYPCILIIIFKTGDQVFTFNYLQDR